jgi:hypothetical protein
LFFKNRNPLPVSGLETARQGATAPTPPKLNRNPKEPNMEKTSKSDLTDTEVLGLFKIRLELEGHLESVKNIPWLDPEHDPHPVVIVERDFKHLFEQASAILGQDVSTYYRLMSVLNRLGIVDELEEERKLEQARSRQIRMEIAERFGLPYADRDADWRREGLGPWDPDLI